MVEVAGRAPVRLHFALAPAPSRLLRARERIRDYLSFHCRDQAAIDDVVLAIEEGCTNAIRHSGSREDIEISLHFEGDDLLVLIRDHGAGFDLGRFDPHKLPDVTAPGGRGLFLMNELMDRLRLRCDAGLEVEMVKEGIASSQPSRQGDGLDDITSTPSPVRREGRLQAMLEELDEAFASLDWEYRYAFVNAGFERLTGHPRQELLGRTVWEMFPALADHPAGHAFRDAMELGAATIIEYESPFTSRWLECRAYPTSSGISIYYRNIDARKRKELERDRVVGELETERALFGTVLDQSPAGIVLYAGDDFIMRVVNQAYQTLASGKPMLGRPFREVWPEVLPALEPIFRRVIETGEPFVGIDERYLLRRSHDGPLEERFFTWTLTRIELPGGEGWGLLNTAVETTASHQAVAALRESETSLRSLTENLPGVLMRFDRTMRVVYLSPQAEAITGLPTQQFIGRTNREVGMPAELCDQWEAGIEEVFRTGSQRELEFDITTPSGDVRTFSLRLAPELGPDGAVKHVLGISIDRTEHRRAEEERLRLLEQLQARHEELQAQAKELRAQAEELLLQSEELARSEERFKALFQRMNEGFYRAQVVFEADGRATDLVYLEVNPAFEGMTGLRRDELVGRRACELAPGLAGAVPEDLGDVIRTGASVRSTHSTQIPARFYDLVVYRLAEDQCAAVVTDVTERMLSQRALELERETLAAVMEGMPAGAEYLDRDFTIRLVNRQFERDIGIDRERLIGRNHFDVLPGAGLRRFLERARDAGRGSHFRALPMELPGRPGRGVTYWDWRVAAVPDASGTTAGLLLSSMDVTGEIKTQRLSDALSRISLKLSGEADGGERLEGVGKLILDALDCDSLLVAQLNSEAASWRRLHAVRFRGDALERQPDHWPETSLDAMEPSFIGDWRNDTRVSPAWRKAWPLRACLFAPLVTKGRVVGGMFVGSRDGGPVFGPAERDFARRCSAALSAALENMDLVNDLRQVAVTLQKNMLHPLPSVAGMQFASVSQPAHEPDFVGGDFHDVFSSNGDEVVVLIGDVGGKGLRAAGITETVRTAIRAFAAVDHSPDFVMRKTSELLQLHELAAEDTFVTAFLALIDVRSGRVRYASAGHPPPVLHRGREADFLPVEFAPPLAVWTDSFPICEARLQPGDTLLLYTDGVTEARGKRGFFGERRLVRTVRVLASRGVQDLAEGIRDAVNQFSSGLRDDVEVLALRFIGLDGRPGEAETKAR